ncbi:MAG: FMN-binding protein, partial [Solobacterium sp.]|nr:FMN-binding protein [Solobacterium sp.]
VPTGTVKSITLDNFSDTPDVGDKATTDDYLKKFVGVSDADDVDGVSGATFTTKSVKSMIQSALDKFRSAGGETAAAAPAEEKPAETAAPAEKPAEKPAETASVTRFKETEPETEEVSNDGTKAVFRVKSGGFSFLNEKGDKNEGEVEIDPKTGKVSKFTVTKFADTPNVGDKATADDYLKKFVGVSDADDVDGVSGATFTTNSVKAMVQSALDQFAKSAKPVETLPSTEVGK